MLINLIVAFLFFLNQKHFLNASSSLNNNSPIQGACYAELQACIAVANNVIADDKLNELDLNVCLLVWLAFCSMFPNPLTFYTCTQPNTAHLCVELCIGNQYKYNSLISNLYFNILGTLIHCSEFSILQNCNILPEYSIFQYISHSI